MKLPEFLKTEAERVLRGALKAWHGNVYKACHAIGIYPGTAYRWIKEFEIDLNEYRKKSD